MNGFKFNRITRVAALLFIVLGLLSMTVAAQSVKVEGLIKARNGDTMILQTSETHQVGNDKTAEGQAENRRVVVRVLQNKAIAGL